MNKYSAPEAIIVFFTEDVITISTDVPGSDIFGSVIDDSTDD